MPKSHINLSIEYVLYFHKPGTYEWDKEHLRRSGKDSWMVSDLMDEETAIAIANKLKAAELFEHNKQAFFVTPSSMYPDKSRVAVNLNEIDVVKVLNEVLDPTHVHGWEVSDEQLLYRYSTLLARREDSLLIPTDEAAELVQQKLRHAFQLGGVNPEKIETIIASLKIEDFKKYVTLTYDAQYLKDLLPCIEKLSPQAKQIQKPAQEAPRGVSTFFSGKQEEPENEQPREPSKAPGVK